MPTLSNVVNSLGLGSDLRKKKRKGETDDELRPEYDLSKLKFIGRGIYAERYRAGTKFVLLDDKQGVEEHSPKEDDLNEPGNISDPR